LVECLPSKEKVAGSNPVHRSRNKIIVNFEEYQKESRKTAIYPGKGKNFIYPTLGLSGEVGEISEKIKKVIRDKNGKVDKETKELLKKELGDVLWYVSQLATELGLSLNTIATANVKKLKSRQKRDKLHGDGDSR
jgi:NTP pyrophosphatase (non-canonical NTP hydrolase)